MVLFYYFVLLWQKKLAVFSVPTFNQEVCRHLYPLNALFKIALNESFTFGFLAAYCLGSV